jgi:EAL domain-containing protein (putative c-di-GMP-specific phosphodiesterase class I)
MRARAHQHTGASNVQSLLEELTREHFAAFPLAEAQPGRVVARFYQSRLTSVFQPVVRTADAGIAGHHGLLRVFDERGEAVAPWNVFARASDDEQLVMLDRLTRTLHALNYFPTQDSAGALFLNVEQRLLSAVSAEHGTYFSNILKRLGVPTSRVVIVLPGESVEDPATFVRAAISYRIRGYRVLVQLRQRAEADLVHIFQADPHYVALDGPEPSRSDETRRIVDALARRGIHSVARRIESAEQAQAARDVGFGFLQGWHFAAGGART